MKTMSRRKYFSLILPLFILLFSCSTESKKTVEFEYLTGKTSLRYLKLTWSDLSPKLVINRPERGDVTNQICLPLTAPDSSEYQIKYFHCIDGDCCPTERYNNQLLGGLLIENEELKLVFPKNLNDIKSIQAECQESGSSFIQLRPILENGNVLASDGSLKFQCRALVTFKDGSVRMIETEKHNTSYGFAEDLKKFGVVNAVLIATGVHDEGWYYYANVPVSLGRLKSKSSEQENWLVLQLKN